MRRTLEVTLPSLHRGGQTHVRDSPARFKVLVAGRRWGKTLLGVALCTKAGLEGKRAWWVGPTYPTASVGWRPLLHLAAQIPKAWPMKTTRTTHYPGGGWVQVRSADKPESLRGEGLDLVVIDEVAHIAKFDEVWEQSLRPALSDRQGKAIFISTPKGYNHFWELYKRADTLDDWASFQHPTWDNPFIAQEEIDAAEAQLPALVFRQEYGAEFVQLAGALFLREWFHIIEEEPAAQYVRSWDLAASTKTTADFTVGFKVGLTQNGDLILADMVRGRWEWPTALQMISDTARADGVAVIQGVEDVGVQKGMFQMLMAEPQLVGLAFRPITVHRDKLTRAMPWLARAEQGKLKMVRGEWNAAALDEICAFPESAHDDIVDAVSGAVQLLEPSEVESPLLVFEETVRISPI